jgi:uncharacterized RDD family membrane protein YckC
MNQTDVILPPGHPWIRLLARTLDFQLFCLLVGFVMGSLMVVGVIPENFAQGRLAEFCFGLLLLFLWTTIMEPVLLSTWGTTLGKWLLKIQLRNKDHLKLSFKEAYKRSVLVCLKGQGAGLPIINLICRLFAYDDLKRKGITSWDKQCQITVTHEKIGKVRATIALLLIAALLYTFCVGMLLASKEFSNF